MKAGHNLVFGLVLASALAEACIPAPKRPTLAAKWENFDYAGKALSASDLAKIDGKSLSLMRGIVFGRHGRMFKDPTINAYLGSKKWYEPEEGFDNSGLNDTERKNLDLIREFEAKKHKNVEPGDLRFWRDKRFTKAQLGSHSLNDLHVMSAEIEAIHGRKFDEEPAMQTYFEARYWYKPAAKFDPKSLGRIERANIATLSSVEKDRRRLKIAPGDMAALQKAALKETQLGGLTLYELRLLRNEVYALRGHAFKTEWLADYFFGQEWYKPNEEGVPDKLTKLDHENVATIQKAETKAHENLVAERLRPKDLEGLFVEDARKLRYEIEARNGKVFKQKWLQGYFESLPWYKKRTDYDPKGLSTLEKANLLSIAGYEKKAKSLMEMTEG